MKGKPRKSIQSIQRKLGSKDIKIAKDIKVKSKYKPIKFNTEKQQAKLQRKINAKEKAARINDVFKSSLPRSHKWKYNPWLAELVQSTLPPGTSVFDIRKGDKNKYFEVDRNYDGDVQKLFEHIKFKTVPQTGVDVAVEKIINAPEDYEEKMNKAQSRAFATNLKNLNMTGDIYFALEDIMNTSAAWNIAAQNAFDSDQVQHNWQMLFDTVTQAKETGNSQLFDEILRDIENEVDLQHIIDKVNKFIKDKIKEG